MNTVAGFVDQVRAWSAKAVADLEAILAAAVAPTPIKRGLLVPGYRYPSGVGLTEFWDKIIAAAASVPVVAIVNVDSGPGKQALDDYTKVIQRALAAGVKVLGYVHTSYGARPSADVLGDIQKWKAFYPLISGIFFDEQMAGAEKVPQYRDWFAAARVAIAGAFVVSNPGGDCDPAYLTTAKPDVLVLVENGGSVPTLPPWATAAPDQHVAVLAYAADEAKMRDRVAAMVSMGVGWVYVTSDILANPWDRLPAYFAAQVALVAAASPSVG